jgi:hypothetical protein
MVGQIAHWHDINGDTDAAEMLHAQAAEIARLRAQLRGNQEADRHLNRDHDRAGVKATLEALLSTMNDG